MVKKFTFFLFILFVLSLNIPLKGQDVKKNDYKDEFISLKKKINSKSSTYEGVMKSIGKYIFLAKEINDNDELYNGYSFGVLYGSGKEKVLYGDSTVMVAMKSQDKRYIGLSYAGLANINFRLNDYKKSLDAALIADQYLQDEISKEFIYEPRFTIAKLKYVIGDYGESTRIIKEIYDYYKWKITKKSDLGINKTYVASLVILMNNNSVMERFGENIALIKEGYTFLNQNPTLNRALFTSAIGLNKFYQKEYNEALNDFNRAISQYKDNDVHHYEMFYSAMCYWKLNNVDEAERLFAPILKEYKESGRMSLEFRPVLEFYIEYYKGKGDKDAQLEAVDQLLLYDRDIYSSQNAIDKRLRKEYDEKRLLDERLTIESYYNRERWSLIAIVVLLIVGTISWYLYNKRKKENQNKQENSLFNIPSQESVNDLLNSTGNNIGNSFYSEVNNIKSKNEDTINYSMYQPINKQTVKIILKSLEDFEKKNQFLQQDLKLGILAERFNTNEKYISKIIKVKTGKNFNNYINDLRFQYLQTQIKSDPDYKDQKIKTISNSLGFGTPELFAKLFKEKYKVSPSEFFSK